MILSLRKFIPVLILLASIVFVSNIVPAKYVSRTGHLHVESANRFKNVVADNYQVYCELNPNTGSVNFTGLLKSFEFELGALDQAFNSGRVDMSQFSKFKYDGQVTNLAGINFDKAGNYPVSVSGNLQMGGYNRKTAARGTLTVMANGKVKADARFSIRIEEESVNTINKLMKEKLPSVFAMDVDKLGISRDIKLSLSTTFRPRG